MVLKSTAVARFKLYHGLTLTCFEIGSKNIPLSVTPQGKENTHATLKMIEKMV
jgi:hypothetical protein